MTVTPAERTAAVTAPAANPEVETGGREEKHGPVLIIAAHPDDPEFGLGATQAKLTAEGRDVHIVLITSGNEGGEDPSVPDEELMAIREEEQQRAGAVLGVKSIEFLRHPDGRIVNNLDLRRDIVRAIRKYRPETIFTHDPANFFSDGGINHPDHRNVGHAVLDAIFPGAGNPRAFRELIAEGLTAHKVKEVYLFFTANPNVWVDVTSYIDHKVEALRQHASQIKNPDDLRKRLHEGMARAGEVHGVGAVEGFRRISFRR
ncbi:MAG: PIG-L family deacetylase [Chloroflexi bacterium]|nr:PIG-L family deacetylase [Chloroflexota bacterium]